MQAWGRCHDSLCPLHADSKAERTVCPSAWTSTRKIKALLLSCALTADKTSGEVVSEMDFVAAVFYNLNQM